MTSTEMNLGVGGQARTSSRVLKPPGGGHSDIFAPPEVKVNPPRPKYDQQNSSNLNCVMNTTDPNILAEKAVEQVAVEPVKTVQEISPTEKKATNGHHENNNEKQKVSPSGGDSAQNGNSGSRGRVPPGGFSAGFW